MHRHGNSILTLWTPYLHQLHDCTEFADREKAINPKRGSICRLVYEGGGVHLRMRGTFLNCARRRRQGGGKEDSCTDRTSSFKRAHLLLFFMKTYENVSATGSKQHPHTRAASPSARTHTRALTHIHSPHGSVGSGAHRRQVLVPLRNLPHRLV